MSSKYTEGAAALDKFATQFKALIDLADVLRAAGSVEQAADEAKARTDKAVADELAAREKLAAVEADIEKGRAEAEDARAQGKADAEKAVSGANSEAEQTLAGAKSKAEDALNDATLQAAQMLSGVQKQVEEQALLLDFSRSELEAVLTRKASAEADLAAVQKQVDEIRARILGSLKA